MKIIALFIILSVSYTLGVFLAPDFLDIYGYAGLNEKIRSMKVTLDTDRANFSSGKALIEKVGDIPKPYIDETKTSVEKVRIHIDTKTEQVKNAADSVNKAYEAVEWAKDDIQKLTNFGTGK